jgi:hypothetical protein
MSPSTGVPSGVPTNWDIFVSHASEDKPYVDALVQKLTEAGIKVWFDRTAIDWGSDIRITIDHGLKNCIYGIVVFSKAFLAQKKWTEYELSGLFALEEPGRTRILPIWHGITETEMKAYSPAFSLRLAKASSRDGYQEIVASVKKMLEKATNPGSEQDLPAATQYGIGVKPECTVPEDYNLPDAFRPMMDEQRSIQRQRPTEDRIYIGGEIIVNHLVKAGCSTFSMGPFEDFVDDMKAIYSRFGPDGSHS